MKTKRYKEVERKLATGQKPISTCFRLTITLLGAILLGLSSCGSKSNQINIKETTWSVVEADSFYYEIAIDKFYNIYGYHATQGFIPGISCQMQDGYLLIGFWDTIFFIDHRTGTSTVGAEFTKITRGFTLIDLSHHRGDLAQRYANAYNRRYRKTMRSRGSPLKEEELWHADLLQE